MRVRLLADDLTGALDTAARLAALAGPLPVVWARGAVPPGAGSLALDAACREGDRAVAAARMDAAAGLLADADLAFLKLDSLLRGHPATAIACCLRTGFDHAVIAPAFPAQGRVTQGGRLVAPGAGAPAPDLGAALAALGVPVALCRSGQLAPPGASLWDAGSDADLLRIVAAGRALPGRVLWCGSAGLAGALAGTPPAVVAFPPPLLALVGSDHPASTRQVAAVATCHVRLGPAGAGDVAVAGLLGTGAAVATVMLPPGMARAPAAAAIAERFGVLVAAIAPPGSLLVSGGETLRAVCNALRATRLVVHGEREPGLAVSVLSDGAWAGTTVLSKSGAFGDDGLLRRLTRAARQ